MDIATRGANLLIGIISNVFLEEIDHPVAGAATYPGPPWWLGPGGWLHGRAPLLGEHTEEVLRDVAGLSARALAAARTGVSA